MSPAGPRIDMWGGRRPGRPAGRLRAAQSGRPARRDPPRSGGRRVPPVGARRRRTGTPSGPRRRAPPPGGRGDRGSGRRILTAGGGYRRLDRGIDHLTSAAMHRQRTKLAQRVNRVASGIERRGIVATYELHERLLGNRAARPAVCLRVAGARRDAARCRRGARPRRLRHASVHRPLDGGRVGAPGAQGDVFVAETERTIAAGGQGKVRAGKEFVVRAHSFEGVTLSGDDPGSRSPRRDGCSTSQTRISGCGRSCPTSTSGTRPSSLRPTSGSPRRTGTSTSTTGIS